MDQNAVSMLSEDGCTGIPACGSYNGIHHYAISDSDLSSMQIHSLLESVLWALPHQSIYGYDASNSIWRFTLSESRLVCTLLHTLPFPFCALCFHHDHLLLGCSDGSLYSLRDSHPARLLQTPSLSLTHLLSSGSHLLLEDASHTLWTVDGSHCTRLLQKRGLRACSATTVFGVEQGRM